MTTRTVSNAVLQGMLSEANNVIVLKCLTLNHSSLTVPLKFVDDVIPLARQEGINDTAYDTTDNNNDLTITSQSNPYVEGLKYSSAIRLTTGTSQKLSVSGVPTGNFTLEAYVYINTLIATTIIRLGDTTDGCYIGITGSGNLQLSIFRSSVQTQVTEATALLVDTWYRVTGTYNGSTMILFINGVSQTPTQALSAQAMPSTMGVTVGSGSGKDIIIDDARIWSIARSQTDIDFDKYLELIGTEANLFGYWKFNEGQFTPFPFDLSLATDDDNTVPSMKLKIANISREIVDEIRSLSGDIGVKLEIIARNTPNTVEVGPYTFYIKNVRGNSQYLTSDLIVKGNYLNESYPYHRFGPSNA